MNRPRKYRNQPTELDGYRFASKAEAKRYAELVLLLKAGAIRDLEVHPHYPYELNGKKIGRGYTADFAYIEPRIRPGQRALPPMKITEDVKGTTSRDWPLRRDLFKALYPDRELRVVK